MAVQNWPDAARTFLILLFALVLILAPSGNAARAQAEAGLQCVPYARQLSGIQIFGDAHLWWQQAAGRYARGAQPAVGAVLSLPAHGSMPLGHVAYVSQIVSAREIRLDHANWSPIGGRRGQVERGARAIDVSANNDWSKVRIWFAPIQALGTTEYRANGFIYPTSPPAAPRTLAPSPAPKRNWVSAPARPKAMTATPAAPPSEPPNERQRRAFAAAILSNLDTTTPAPQHSVRAARQPVDLIGELIGQSATASR
jgi:surface antigen